MKTKSELLDESIESLVRLTLELEIESKVSDDLKKRYPDKSEIDSQINSNLALKETTNHRLKKALELKKDVNNEK